MSRRRRLPLAKVEEIGPCRECGACCASGVDYGFYADLEESDLKRLGRDRALRYTVHVRGGDLGSSSATLTKENSQGLIVCKALRGSVGGRCSCAIYEVRPKVCRAFKRGSKGCLEARREFLLPPEE